MHECKKKYEAILWYKDDDAKPGLRETVYAVDGFAALRFLKEKYGEGTIISIHNDEDANTIR